MEEKEGLSTEENRALIPIMSMYMEMNSKTPRWEREFAKGQNQVGFDSEGKEEIPFSVIEQPPVFPECQELELMYQRQCMAKRISEFVNENFNTKVGQGSNLKGRQRISIMFKIDEKGDVFDVKSKALSPSLETEAKRVVKSLPKMVPGKMNGENVVVKYSLPIIFEMPE